MTKERAELHMHTQMFETDGIASFSAYIKRAAAWGCPAIGLADHGCVQAFPEAMCSAEECKKRINTQVSIYLEKR